jgi:hypothetical protein
MTDNDVTFRNTQLRHFPIKMIFSAFRVSLDVKTANCVHFICTDMIKI